MDRHFAMGSAMLVVTVMATLAAGPFRDDAHASAGSKSGVSAARDDLVHLDTDTGHYVQAANGLTTLDLYNSPVGNPDASGWRFRDTSLSTLAGTQEVAPASLPFDVRLAPTSAGPTLAALKSEDGVSLGLGLTSIDGVSPATVQGQVSGDTITYPAIISATTPASNAAVSLPATSATTALSSTPTMAAAAVTGTAVATPTTTVAASPAGPGSATADLSLHPTISGLDVRVTLSGPLQGGALVFALAPDARTSLVQDAGGVVRVTQAMTGYADDEKTPFTYQQPEYVLEPPLVADSSAGPVASINTAPTTMTLGPAQGGWQSLTLSIDPTWLQAPHRVYPVRIDLPIASALAIVHTGGFGTVNSCAPNTRAPLARVAVGVEGTCAYRGEVYFNNVSSLLPDTPIVSAILHLYTPTQLGATGVQVYPNGPTSSMTGWQPWVGEQPSWDMAPAVDPGAAAIAQTGSAGHWQTWDVTAVVRRWVQSQQANTGLTLVGDGAPTLFASPLGAGDDGPATAPYLEITYAPRPAVSPFYTDPGVPFVYGISGSYTVADNTCPSGYLFLPSCSGNIKIGAVASPSRTNPMTENLGGYYLRTTIQLECNTPSPGATWWNSYGNAGAADPHDSAGIQSVLDKALLRGLVPTVQIVANGSCGSDMTPTRWQQEMTDFSNFLHNTVQWPLRSMIYFEIGNEENVYPGYPLYNSGSYGYKDVFASAALALQNTLQTGTGWGYVNFRIITGGQIQPHDRSPSDTSCIVDSGGLQVNTYTLAQSALSAAEGAGVQVSHLGVGVHPYHYNTSTTSDWQNYYAIGNGPAVCGLLDGMLNLWTGFKVPVVFTEINWTDNPSGSTCTDPTRSSDDRTCQGTYLADLFSWFYDHNLNGIRYDGNNSPIRVMWYRGADSGDSLGIFTPNGRDKAIPLYHCTNRLITVQPAPTPSANISALYYDLRAGTCY